MARFQMKIYARNRERTEDPLGIGEVLTIIGGPHIAGNSRSARDMYRKEARNLPQVHVRWADKHLNRITR